MGLSIFNFKSVEGDQFLQTTISHQCIVMSFFKYIILCVNKMTLQCTGDKWSLVKIGLTNRIQCTATFP